MYHPAIILIPSRSKTLPAFHPLILRQDDVYSSILQIVQAMPGQLPWTHNLVLLEHVNGVDVRLWYAKEASECIVGLFLQPKY